MLELSDSDLLLRLKNFEDHFVERKTSGDSKDWLKTVVGFANSAPIGYPAVLYIGVRDAGEIEDNLNLDSLQKTLGKKLAHAYPPIYYLNKVLKEGGKQFLAVIVPGSAERPHFAGPAYMRRGSETVDASESEFQSLVAQRQSKVYEILKWKGKEISVEIIEGFSPASYAPPPSVEDCNGFYVTLKQTAEGIGGSAHIESHPLGTVQISFDHGNRRLKLTIAGLRARVRPDFGP